MTAAAFVERLGELIERDRTYHRELTLANLLINNAAALREVVEAAQEIIDASDNALIATDDVEAMLRFGIADERVRDALAKLEPK